MEKKQIMDFWKPFLWSYDVDKMDIEKDKERIITNVLNSGTHEATKLLFKVYPVKEVSKVLKNPLPGEWNKKSLNFWSLMLRIKPNVHARKISKS